ncbi:MAG: excinuclease ABC subunit UvrC [Enterovibrio sp.]
MFDEKSFLKTVSEQPGVYRMMNAAEEIIYVGKAKSLKKRLSSYFREQHPDKKTQVLVRQIAKIEVTVTHTETEALILENNLIKQHLPRYNVLLKDDKSYPYIFLSSGKHPRLGALRSKKALQGDHFGPFPDGAAVKQCLDLLQKIFLVRQCEDSVYANRTRPCLMYQIGRCAAPCVAGIIADEKYAELVQFTRLFLQGKDHTVLKLLIEKMEQASTALQFEQAAKYRDQIQAVKQIQAQQHVSDLGALQEGDAIALAYENGVACVHVLCFRKGKILASHSYFPAVPANTQSPELLSAFVGQYYFNNAHARAIPQQILLSEPLDDEDATLTQGLCAVAGRKVAVLHNLRAGRAKLVQLAKMNAQAALASKLSHKQTLNARFDALCQTLALKELQRIECFDISHTQGQQTIASCVVFGSDGPMKSLFRRYNISGITPGDDYAAMAQVLEKRYGKIVAPENIPDLILIDGGKGQLNRAWQIIEPFCKLWPKQPLVLGVAKGVTRKAGLETIIKIDGTSFFLDEDSPALHLIQQVRDASHDHAISGHRAKRAKLSQSSVLQELSQVGPKRRQALLKYFGGMQELKRASVDEIAKVPGISRVLAQKIFYQLQGS